MELFLDTMYIEDEREIALVPNKTYSKIPNIYFVPSISALKTGVKEQDLKNLKFWLQKPMKTNKEKQNG